MTESRDFTFGDSSVARSYDDVLVPTLFEPWAARLIEEHQPWARRQVLDLATGTGVVARLLAEQVGSAGCVLGADINREMLQRAQKWRGDSQSTVRFVECSAESLDCPDDSIDFVVCQQGFQFFPDKKGAAAEILRVLKAGGKTVVSTWRPVGECQVFGAICEALESIDEPEISSMMRVPFDFMPESELADHFESSGFDSVRVERQEQDLVMRDGLSQAVEFAYSTPIGPKLRSLPDGKEARFRTIFFGLVNELSSDGKTMGRMASNVLSAEK